MTGRTNFHLSIDRGENRPFYRQIFQIFWLQSLKVKTIRTSVLIEKSFFFYEKERAKYAIQTILILFHISQVVEKKINLLAQKKK